MTDPVVQPAGQILDDLGVQLALRPGDVPVSAVVVIDVMRADGEDGGVLLGVSERTRWPTQIGLIEAARIITESPGEEEDE